MTLFKNSFLKIFLIPIIYFLSTLLFSFFFYSTIGDYLISNTNINLDYLLILDFLTYLFSYGLVYLLFLKNEIYSNILKFKNIRLYHFLILISIAIFYRVSIDPLYRIKLIFNQENYPNLTIINYSYIKLTFTVLNVIILVPILEELIFRRAIIKLLINKRENIYFAIILSSFLFSLIHINFLDINFISIINSFLFGIVLAIIYIKLGLKYSILLHVFSNLIWFLLSINTHYYWELIRELNFDYKYWLICFISSGVLIVLLLIISKKRH